MRPLIRVSNKKRQNATFQNHFKLLQPEEISIDFDKIIGHKECKMDLVDILQYLQNPAPYEQYGVIPYSKYMLIGPDGVGKSSLACAVAKTAKLPIFIVEPSFFLNANEVCDRIDILFNEVLTLFNADQKCIMLFKDVQYFSNMQDEILPSILEKLLSYFRQLPQLVAFATFSNSINAEISKLLIDPPAFNKIITMSVPELKTREQLLTNLLIDKPVDSNLSIHRLALDTSSMTTGAIKTMVKAACLKALQNNQAYITYNNFAEVLAQSDFGYTNGKLNEKERLSVARHEAGHIVAGYFSDPDNFKITKVEITPRSFYLGITQQTADEEKKSYFRNELEAQIIFTLGGMASEEFFYHATSSGVENDLEKATTTALLIYKAYGMAKKVGPMSLLLDSDANITFDIINEKADLLIQEFLKQMYAKTQKLISKHQNILKKLTDKLMEKEVLYTDEIMSILKQ